MISGLPPVVTPLNSPYWEGTAAGELRIRLCRNCGARFRFVRELCPECWSDDLGWQIATGKATVIARAIVETAPYEAMDQRVPYVLALVQLIEGPTMMANVIGIESFAVAIGQQVEVCFEHRGDFFIPQFRPISDGKTD